MGEKLNGILRVPPFEQALGAMGFSLPGLFLSWLLVFGYTPITLSSVSLAFLLYLSLIASLVGFPAYYHILNQ